MQTTLAAISLIRSFEGFRPEAYLDPKGIWTIGSGLTRWADGKPVGPGDEISPERDEEEMFHHIRKEVEPAMDRHFQDVPLQPNQRDALASFVYNLGPDADKKYSTLKAKIVDQAPLIDIARQWVKYRNKGSNFELGLYRRRVAEVLMWAGLPWEGAKDIELRDDVEDVIANVSADTDLFDQPEPVAEPALPEYPPKGWKEKTEHQQTEWLNENQPLKVKKKVHTIPVKQVRYLETTEPKVKDMKDSQRGKGFAKEEIAKASGTVAIGGMVADQVGIVEPVVAFAEKYSPAKIATVFIVLGVISIVVFYWGKWQRQKGEDEADTLLQ
ncbi:MAG: lysozyme [Pseudomonadota bacterium]